MEKAITPQNNPTEMTTAWLCEIIAVIRLNGADRMQ